MLEQTLATNRPYNSAERQAGGTVAGADARAEKPRWRIEDLPKPLLCVPLVAQWLLLAARHGSLTLPSAVNPSIETGGLAGESKSACLAQIAGAFASHVAAWRLVCAGDAPLAARHDGGFAYPLIVKPDIGWCGYGVRRVDDDAGLLAYAAAFPRDAAFIMQRLVTDPNEAGLFYVREPGAPSGTIAAMTLRHAPHVIGDGTRCVAALMAADQDHWPRVHGLDAAALARVPARGERVALTTIASLRAGARYEDATDLITPALTAQLDAIARSMPDFHLGRFDVRFPSLNALQAGVFCIIEVNGAGSEAIQFWDTSLTLRQAFAGVFAKQCLLFRLGARMRGMGHRPVGAWALARAWLRQQRLMARYPASN
jgi:hypothetical protein